jgi:hypothetical protein
MGMSTRISCYISDKYATYQKYKEVLLVCNAAKVDLPKEVADYFGYKYPELCALEEKLELDLEEGVHYYEAEGHEMEEGFDVILANLPVGNSY